jgi:hypothetical protein
MQDYNRLISSRILDGYEEMLDNVPQETMLGGKRMRNYILPASTEYDFPASLSVGTMDGKYASTLGGSFFKDFNQGFPMGMENLEGGASHSTPRIGNPRRIGGKKSGVGKALKSVGKVVAPIAKDLAITAAKKGIKEGFKGGRRKKGVLHSVGRALKSVGKVAAPVAKEIFQDVILPEGKKALKEYIKNAMKPSSSEYDGEVAYAEAIPFGKGRKPKGGVLIRDDPSQFHSSVYPPSLASYAAKMPKGKDAYGRGRAKLPASGAKRNSARGAIVAEVMKKHGLSLGEASKFVKEKGLY